MGTHGDPWGPPGTHGGPMGPWGGGVFVAAAAEPFYLFIHFMYVFIFCLYDVQ